MEIKMNEDAIRAISYKYLAIIYWVLSQDDVPDEAKLDIRRRMSEINK